MSNEKMTRDEAIAELVEHYEDPDFRRFQDSEDEGPFYVLDAELFDLVIGALGGKVKPAGTETFSGGGEGDEDDSEADLDFEGE